MTSFSISTTILLAVFGCLFQHASAEVQYQNLHLIPTYAKVHGVVMGLAFVVILPVGAILVRTLSFKRSLWIHVACQLVGTILMVVGLATGVRMVHIFDNLNDTPHAIFGLVLVSLLLLQPLWGLIHHRRFMKTKERSAWTRLHVWYGRVLMALGILNGGLGLSFASNTMAGKIVYAVLAGLVGLGYCLILAFLETRKRRVQKESSVISVEERR